MQRPQRAPALAPVFPADQEVAGGNEQHELVDGRIDALHEIGDALEQRDYRP